MPNKHYRPSRRGRFASAVKIVLINVAAMTAAAGGLGWPAQAVAQEQPSVVAGETRLPPFAKEELRYAGRDFGDWRRQLLTDLEPKTQIAAIEALLAFSKKGYAEEAVAAIGQALESRSEQVRQTAFNALGEIGPAAVPVLVAALRDKARSVRAGAIRTLAEIGPAAREALDPLRLAVQDEDQSVRQAAAHSLAKVGAGETRLLPAFEQLARNADMQMRVAVLSGLLHAGANDPRFVPLFLRALDDDHWEVRQWAGEALIRGGPPSREVIEGLTRLVREDLERFRRRHQFDATAGSIVLALAREERNLATVAPVLVEAASIVLTNPAFAQWSWVDALLEALVRLGPKVAPAVPALVQFIALASPAQSSSIILAIDALAAIGEAAREAAPALEAWLAAGENADSDIQRHAAKALRSIHSDE